MNHELKRKIDALVERHFFGQKHGHLWATPLYSFEWAASARVLEKIREDLGGVIIVVRADTVDIANFDDRSAPKHMGWPDDREISASGPDLPMATCLFALKAVGMEVPD